MGAHVERCLHSVLFCNVYVAFRLAVIEMHRYSSSNLKNYFGFRGHVAPVPPWIRPCYRPNIFGKYVLLSDIDSQFTAM